LGPTEKFDKITTFEKLKMDLIMWVEWKGQNVGRLHTKGHTKELSVRSNWVMSNINDRGR